MDDRMRGYLVEAAIGLALALLVLLVAAASVTTVHFVYQGF
jgi:hypothetical protein